MGWSIEYIEVSQVYNFQIKKVFLSLKICFVLANSLNPDEMPHHAEFHLGLHCSSKYTFRSHNCIKGYNSLSFITK